MSNEPTCRVPNCPALVSFGSYCPAHKFARPAVYSSVCVKCKRPIRGGKHDVAGEFIVEQLGELGGTMFAHAACVYAQPKPTKQPPVYELLDAIEHSESEP